MKSGSHFLKTLPCFSFKKIYLTKYILSSFLLFSLILMQAGEDLVPDLSSTSPCAGQQHDARSPASHALPAIGSGSICSVSRVEPAFGPSPLFLLRNNTRNCVEDKAHFKLQFLSSVINNREMSFLTSLLHEGT